MKTKRLLSILLSVVLMLTAVAFPASAAETTYLCGDTDFSGKITSADILNLQCFVLGSNVPVGNEEQAYDVNGDELMNSIDVLAATQYLLGVSDDLGRYTRKFWSAVPMTSASQSAAGIYGGEGCQWPVFITFDETDGNVAYMGTDVGGMYKSTDGGITWDQASIGVGSAGVGCIKIDPKNSNRVLVQGINSSAQSYNGLYLSTDGGVTYSAVKNVSIKGNRDFRDCIAFDASSYSGWSGYSANVYWLKEDGTLYKSTNGGSSWSSVTTNDNYKKGHIFVHPTSGYVYIASSAGFFRSTDNGSSFTKISSVAFNGMDVISTQPDNIYLSSNSGIYISTDSGATITQVAASGLPKYPTRIEVSPVNPNYMVVDNDMLANESSYSNIAYYSHDSGKTWSQTNRDTTGSVIPYNARNNVFSWSPTDANVCISLGGKTYTNLTSTRNNVYPGDDGGRQVTRLCINPATRHLFAGGGCRGIFKVALDQ